FIKGGNQFWQKQQENMYIFTICISKYLMK
ncbi:hypothetical protein A5834_001881, partial [Enterococcus faecium]